MQEFNPIDMLRTLVRHEVDFIIVGGVAGSLAGSALSTDDLDLVYDCTDDNNERLANALREFNAHYKDLAGRHIVPDASKLASIRVNLLRTDLGDLDLLMKVGQDLTYSDLSERTVEYDLEEGLRVRAVDLETLIEAKEYADRPKDRYALPFLRELLEMKR